MASRVRFVLPALLLLLAQGCSRDQAPTTAPSTPGTLGSLTSGSSGGSANLQVNKTGGGDGTVTSNPGGITCGSNCSKSFNKGTVVTLTATPAAGSTFMGWDGGGCSGTGPCTVELDSNTTVSAAFESGGGTSTNPMTFLETTLPDGNVGADYSASINTNGGSGGQDEFRIVSGSLPDGLQMARFLGVQSTVITGKPQRQQTSTFTVLARDNAGSAARTFTITIGPPAELAIAVPGPVASSGTRNIFYLQNLLARGGEAPYAWSITGGELPPGLRLVSASDGNRIEGTPTRAGSFTFTLTVRDKRGQQVSQETTISIN